MLRRKRSHPLGTRWICQVLMKADGCLPITWPNVVDDHPDGYHSCVARRGVDQLRAPSTYLLYQYFSAGICRSCPYAAAAHPDKKQSCPRRKNPTQHYFYERNGLFAPVVDFNYLGSDGFGPIQTSGEKFSLDEMVRAILIFSRVYSAGRSSM